MVATADDQINVWTASCIVVDKQDCLETVCILFQQFPVELNGFTHKKQKNSKVKVM